VPLIVGEIFRVFNCCFTHVSVSEISRGTWKVLSRFSMEEVHDECKTLPRTRHKKLFPTQQNM
jgi:hypothetical protein